MLGLTVILILVSIVCGIFDPSRALVNGNSLDTNGDQVTHRSFLSGESLLLPGVSATGPLSGSSEDGSLQSNDLSTPVDSSSDSSHLRLGFSGPLNDHSINVQRARSLDLNPSGSSSPSTKDTQSSVSDPSPGTGSQSSLDTKSSANLLSTASGTSPSDLPVLSNLKNIVNPSSASTDTSIGAISSPQISSSFVLSSAAGSSSVLSSALLAFPSFSVPATFSTVGQALGSVPSSSFSQSSSILSTRILESSSTASALGFSGAGLLGTSPSTSMPSFSSSPTSSGDGTATNSVEASESASQSTPAASPNSTSDVVPTATSAPPTVVSLPPPSSTSFVPSSVASSGGNSGASSSFNSTSDVVLTITSAPPVLQSLPPPTFTSSVPSSIASGGSNSTSLDPSSPTSTSYVLPTITSAPPVLQSLPLPTLPSSVPSSIASGGGNSTSLDPSLPTSISDVLPTVTSALPILQSLPPPTFPSSVPSGVASGEGNSTPLDPSLPTSISDVLPTITSALPILQSLPPPTFPSSVPSSVASGGGNSTSLDPSFPTSISDILPTITSALPVLQSLPPPTFPSSVPSSVSSGGGNSTSSNISSTLSSDAVPTITSAPPILQSLPPPTFPSSAPSSGGISSLSDPIPPSSSGSQGVSDLPTSTAAPGSSTSPLPAPSPPETPTTNDNPNTSTGNPSSSVDTGTTPGPTASQAVPTIAPSTSGPTVSPVASPSLVNTPNAPPSNTPPHVMSSIQPSFVVTNTSPQSSFTSMQQAPAPGTPSMASTRLSNTNTIDVLNTATSAEEFSTAATIPSIILFPTSLFPPMITLTSPTPPEASPSPPSLNVLSVTGTNPQFSYITASDLLTTVPPTTSVSDTLGDPDAAPTTSTLSSSSVPSIPATLPRRIFSPNSVDPNTDAAQLKDKTLISILFQNSLNWNFINRSDQTVGQLFAFMPQVIANALAIDPSTVMTYALQLQVPLGWNGDVNTLGTTYMAYIPQNEVDPLALMIRTPTSGFYNQAGVAGQIANSVVSSSPLTAGSLDVVPGVITPSNKGNSAKRRRMDTIIGVCATAVGVSLIVAIWWATRYTRRKMQAKHRRLKDLSDPNWSGGVYGTHNDDRRTSFFYAHDQLQAGYCAVPPPTVPQVPPPGSIGANAMQQRTRAQAQPRRRPRMRQVSISAPVLQFSSVEY